MSRWLVVLAVLVSAGLVVALLVMGDDPTRPLGAGGADRAGRPAGGGREGPAGGERPSPLEGGTADRLDAAPALPRAATPARRLSGVVRRRADETPLPRVPVRGTTARAVTDHQGRFALDVGRDEAVLVIEHAGREHAVDVPAGPDDVEGWAVLVDTGWTFTGVVRRRSGGVVGGAEVVVETAAGRAATTADAAGRYVVRDVVFPTSGEAWWELSARAGRGTRAGTASGPATVHEVDLVLSPASVLAGRVVDAATGTGTAGVTVRLPYRVGADGLDPPGLPLRAVTGAGGSFRLDGVPPGRYLVVAEGAGPAEASSPPPGGPSGGAVDRPAAAQGAAATWVGPVDVPSGGEARRDLVRPAGAVVTGTVTDALGRPLSGARVEATVARTFALPTADRFTQVVGDVAARFDGSELTLVVPAGRSDTDEGGRFGLGRLPPGTVTLVARRPERAGLQPVELDLRLGPGERRDGLRLVLGGGRVLSGSVTDRLGRPLPGVRIELAAAEGDALLVGADAVVSDEAGRFVLEGLPEGPLRLVADADGHRPAVVPLADGQEVVEVVLEPAAAVWVRVLDAPTREPLRRYRLSLETRRMTASRGVATDDGRQRVDSLENDEHELTIAASGYRPRRLVLSGSDFDGRELVVLLEPE